MDRLEAKQILVKYNKWLNLKSDWIDIPENNVNEFVNFINIGQIEIGCLVQSRINGKEGHVVSKNNRGFNHFNIKYHGETTLKREYGGDLKII